MFQEAYGRWINELETGAQARRCAVLKANTTAEQARVWAADVRAWFRDAVGPVPPPDAAMMPERTGVLERDGYRIEKWLFPMLPGTWTSANLYVPKTVNREGLAICAPVGHWPEGKAVKDYQQMAGFMALHGIPVLVYDHPGIGERREYLSEVTGASLLGKSPSDEHCHTGALATLAGIPPARFYIAEAVRAFEFLSSFPFVNRARIGFTGASGGGTLSLFAGAYVETTAFAIPVCIVHGEEIGSGADAEQQRPDAGHRGVAAVDLLSALAPKPTMIVTETEFGATAKSFAALRHHYGIVGAPEKVDYFAVEDVHGYTHPMVEAVYAFLARNFGLPAASLDAWNRIRMVPEPETWCSPSGCLVRDRPQITLQEQIANMAPRPSGMSRDKLATRLGISDWKRSPVPYGFTGEVAGRIRVTGAVVAKPGELGLMAWVEKPADYFHGQSAIYRSSEAAEARRLMGFRRSLVGLRVRQILDFLEDGHGVRNELVAEREWSIPLVLACALAPASLLPRATVRYLPACFRDQLRARLYTTPVSSIVPGLLEDGDIDDIITLCEGRLTVEHRVDATGRVIAVGHQSGS